MKRRVLLDTGPLVALIREQDQFHAWATAQFAALEPPLLTCEAVITENFGSKAPSFTTAFS